MIILLERMVLDMTICDLSVRTARNEVKHISGSSKPSVIIGSDKDRNKGCRREAKDHMEFLCELDEAQAKCGRYSVHEQPSEVNSRMRTLVADLCMFGLVACDEGGPGFVNTSVRTVNNARNVGMRMQRTCTGMHLHVGVGVSASEKREQSGAWVREVARPMEERGREDEKEL